MKPYSIIIPVYNEEKLLRKQIKRIVRGLEKMRLKVNYEIILVENGSTDKTCQIANQLKKQYSFIKIICLPFASYGQAFKEGLKHAQYPYIFQFDIDFWDLDFILKSQKLLNSFDFVIGSKNHNHSLDKRSFTRKLVSKFLEKVIDVRFNISISDTHGLKAVKKSMAYQFIDRITCPNHFFDSELLIRAIKENYTFTELPVSLEELRKSRFSFSVRIKEVIKEFALLMTLQLEKRKALAVNYKLLTNK